MSRDSHNPIDPDLEARIVALVMGEASDFERDTLNQLMNERPEVAAFKRQMERAHELLLEAGTGEFEAPEEDWKLPADQRNAVLATIRGEATVQPAISNSQEPAHRVGPDKRSSGWRQKQVIAVACLAGVFGLLLYPFVIQEESSSELFGGTALEIASVDGVDVEDWTDVDRYHRLPALTGPSIMRFDANEWEAGNVAADGEQRARELSALSAIRGTLDSEEFLPSPTDMSDDVGHGSVDFFMSDGSLRSVAPGQDTSYFGDAAIVNHARPRSAPERFRALDDTPELLAQNEGGRAYGRYGKDLNGNGNVQLGLGFAVPPTPKEVYEDLSLITDFDSGTSRPESDAIPAPVTSPQPPAAVDNRSTLSRGIVDLSAAPSPNHWGMPKLSGPAPSSELGEAIGGSRGTDRVMDEEIRNADDMGVSNVGEVQAHRETLEMSGRRTGDVEEFASGKSNGKRRFDSMLGDNVQLEEGIALRWQSGGFGGGGRVSVDGGASDGEIGGLFGGGGGRAGQANGQANVREYRARDQPVDVGLGIVELDQFGATPPEKSLSNLLGEINVKTMPELGTVITRGDEADVERLEALVDRLDSGKGDAINGDAGAPGVAGATPLASSASGGNGKGKAATADDVPYRNGPQSSPAFALPAPANEALIAGRAVTPLESPAAWFDRLDRPAEEFSKKRSEMTADEVVLHKGLAWGEQQSAPTSPPVSGNSRQVVDENAMGGEGDAGSRVQAGQELSVITRQFNELRRYRRRAESGLLAGTEDDSDSDLDDDGDLEIAAIREVEARLGRQNGTIEQGQPISRFSRQNGIATDSLADPFWNKGTVVRGEQNLPTDAFGRNAQAVDRDNAVTLNGVADRFALPTEDDVVPDSNAWSRLSATKKTEQIADHVAELSKRKSLIGKSEDSSGSVAADLQRLLPETRRQSGEWIDGRVHNSRRNFGRGLEGRSGPTHRALPNRVTSPASINEKIASEEAFSTFSLHVSDVSFKLALAALGRGEWPEAAKVRIEEFVNAFDYGDPLPCNGERVACQLEQSIHPFVQQRNLLRVSMRTGAAGRSSNTPLRLTLLVDNSGSMERIDRQQTVRRAFALLAQQLTPGDQVTLISFARQPRLLADKMSGGEAGQLVRLIDELPSEGGTNVEAALQLGFEKAREMQSPGAQNRIILLTDGAVNLGNANPENLSQMVTTMRHAGIAFDAAGISADGLNDEILEALTRRGDGRYYLLDSHEAVDDGFARQVAGALRPSAKNVKVQVEFNPERVGRYKLLGFEKHRLKKEDFRNDKVDAAEMAAAEAGIALYQFEAKPDGEGDVGSVSVRFRELSTGQMVEHRWPIPYEADASRADQATPSLRLATAAGLLAAKLRGEPLGESVDLQTLSYLIAGLPDQYRNVARVQQLQQMIEQARQLSEK